MSTTNFRHDRSSEATGRESSSWTTPTNSFQKTATDWKNLPKAAVARACWCWSSIAGSSPRSSTNASIRTACKSIAARPKNPLDPKQPNQWLVSRAKTGHGFTLPKQAAQLLFDLTECEFGRMEQELSKIALFADDQGNIPMDTVKQVVGGWRTRTMWDAVDAALSGDAGKALDLLDLIFRGGEHPLALFGSLSWSLRRYANATEEVLRQMRSGRKPSMQAALKSAGLGGWGGENAEAHLKQIGSARAKQLSQWLLEADLQLKRSHAHESRGRFVLEKLFVKLAQELKA
jgi:DNA polymerase-3 subunit delta